MRVTITDAAGQSATSFVNVTVNQTLTSIALTPASVSIPPSGTQQFAAVAKDQFGNDYLPAPTLTWTATAGTIDCQRPLHRALTTTTATIRASSGSLFSNSATVTTVNNPPTIATPAAANPNPAAGTTANLSVLGADDWGEANLTYTWTAIRMPPGATQPTYTVNGTNAAKNTTATFSAAGCIPPARHDHRFHGLIDHEPRRRFRESQTLTSIVVAPASAQVLPGGTQQFTARGQRPIRQRHDHATRVDLVGLRGQHQSRHRPLHRAPHAERHRHDHRDRRHRAGNGLGDHRRSTRRRTSFFPTPRSTRI